MEVEKNSNVLFEPDFSKFSKQENMMTDFSGKVGNTTMNRSSMITYSKIICCICGASIEANAKGICEACEKKNVDISSGITKEGIIHYCKGCDRYQRPPWIKCAPESQDMMSLCLSKIKGLNKAKIIDSSFVWTEAHSKLIKIKLTIQKEMNKNIITTSFIVDFKVEWTQCDDCKKTFTPHVWNASVQVRQKVNHKRTFMMLEQLILKHRAHAKALNIKEHPEGVDFYFANKSQANSFIAFLGTVLPIKTKQSRQLISHDQKSNIFNYKYTFMVEIAPVCKDDLIVLDEETKKALGGIGPVLLCYKQSWKLYLVDPGNFKSISLEGSVYWRHEFRSYVDRECLSEFLILSCEEEIDYEKKYLNEKIEKEKSRGMDVETVNTSRLNTSKAISQYDIEFDKKLERNHFKIVNVKCVRNKENLKGESNSEIIEVQSFLGEKMHPGDVYYGYDLTQINLPNNYDDLIKNQVIPKVILVKKKYKTYKKIFKLKRLNMEVDDGRQVKKGKKDRKEKDFEEFVHDIAVNKDLRDQINLYKDDIAIAELEKDLGKMGVAEGEEGDSDVDIKVEELLDNLNLNDDEVDNKNNEEEDDHDNDNEDKEEEKKKEPKKGKQIGKRERGGEHVEDE